MIKLRDIPHGLEVLGNCPVGTLHSLILVSHPDVPGYGIVWSFEAHPRVHVVAVRTRDGVQRVDKPLSEWWREVYPAKPTPKPEPIIEPFPASVEELRMFIRIEIAKAKDRS